MRELTVQIQTRISSEMKDRLEQLCKERRVSQGAVIDEALDALFAPDPLEETKLDTVLHLLGRLHEQINALATGGAQPAAAAIQPPTDLLAFYARLQQDPTEREAPARELPLAVPDLKPRGVRRWFLKG